MADRRGVFVTGTDTDVGKTVVAACLAAAWNAAYWKPIQTGLADGPGDTAAVKGLAGLPAERVLAPAYAFQAPLSPHAAAAEEGAAIALETISWPAGHDFIVVEGAGGLLVPLNDAALMIDLIQKLDLPAVVVARSTLGTINHTLLSLSALRARRIPILGVVMNGPPNASNRRAIEQFGQVRVIAELPRREPLDAAAMRDLIGRIPARESVLP
jgi:malonyl-CoA O-methyltransferase